MRARDPVRTLYVRFLIEHAASPESCLREVETTDPAKIVMPEGAIGFRFFSVLSVEIEDGDELHVLKGEEKHETARYYVGCKAWSIDELKLRPDAAHLDRLIPSMIDSRSSLAIQTPRGQWVLLRDTDVVLEKAT